jgi:hypothetical protein
MKNLLLIPFSFVSACALADPSFVCDTYKHHIEVKALADGTYSYSAINKNGQGKMFVQGGRRVPLSNSCSQPEYHFRSGNTEYIVSDSFCQGSEVIVTDRAFVDVRVNGKSVANLGCDKH